MTQPTTNQARIHFGTEVPMCRAYRSKRIVTKYLAKVTCRCCQAEVSKLRARVRQSRNGFYEEMDRYNDTRTR